MKKYILFASFIMLFYGGLFLYNSKTINEECSGTMYNYIMYDNEDSILEDSDIIVRGTVLKVKTENINIASDGDEPFIKKYKVVEFQVTDVVKGDINKGDIIQVKYLVEDSYNLDKLLNKKSDCLLFLKDYKDIDENMPYSLISPNQGVINFDKDNSINLFNKIPKKDLPKYLKNKNK